MQFWENDCRYSDDLELFLIFWNNIEGCTIETIIEQLEIKLMDKVLFLKNYKKISKKNRNWEIAREYIFFEDIEFVLKQLKLTLKDEKMYVAQYPEFPNKVERENKLIDHIKSKFNFLR